MIVSLTSSLINRNRSSLKSQCYYVPRTNKRPECTLQLPKPLPSNKRMMRPLPWFTANETEALYEIIAKIINFSVMTKMNTPNLLTLKK